jgi:hypothetical protein
MKRDKRDKRLLYVGIGAILLGLAVGAVVLVNPDLLDGPLILLFAAIACAGFAVCLRDEIRNGPERKDKASASEYVITVGLLSGGMLGLIFRIDWLYPLPWMMLAYLSFMEGKRAERRADLAEQERNIFRDQLHELRKGGPR